jgi:hypothetical protein
MPALTRVLLIAALFLGAVAPSKGQGAHAEPGRHRSDVHWRKYINKEFGFSLWYPETYRLSNWEGICDNNEYSAFLLCLERQDDPDSTIGVTIILKGPFFVESDIEGVPYPRRRIGKHEFYCGVVGSMGVGFSDKCTFNLRGKVLEFEFSPAETINSGKTVNPLASKMLKTFRVL